jgi:hypothetical protein
MTMTRKEMRKPIRGVSCRKLDAEGFPILHPRVYSSTYQQELYEVITALVDAGIERPADWICEQLDISHQTLHRWFSDPSKPWARRPTPYAIKYLQLLVPESIQVKQASGPWTEAETNFIKLNYRVLGMSECARRLGRPVDSCKAQAKKFGLQRTRKQAASDRTADVVDLGQRRELNKTRINSGENAAI